MQAFARPCWLDFQRWLVNTKSTAATIGVLAAQRFGVVRMFRISVRFRTSPPAFFINSLPLFLFYRRWLKTDPRLQTAHDANSADMLGEAAMGERVRV
jgi:hypothetical protein